MWEGAAPTRREASLRILHVAAELFPWVRTGGLGDVIAALPPALIELGIDARLVLPGFAGFLDAFELGQSIRLRTPFAVERVRIARALVPDSQVAAYVVDNPALYDRPGNPYAALDGGEWPDNHRRFALLGWVAAALAQGADPNWRPDVLHCHDWHAGLGPAYLRAEGASVPSVFTVHNLAYQGYFPAALFPDLALPAGFFSVDGVEFYGGLSFLKSGLFYADRLTTVSPTYAREIQTPAFGWGLDGLLRTRADALTGILNGVDPKLWSPDHDPALRRGYAVDDAPVGKAAAKAALERRFGLARQARAPLFGAVTRLTPQKGLDLLLAALPGLVALGGRLVLLGSGDRDLEAGFAAAAANYPGRVGVALGYDEALSHLIMAGSDAVIMPSRFEPCGLGQLISLRYGTIPVVRAVGGLATTVHDVDADAGRGNGFSFKRYEAAAFADALQRALHRYRADGEPWVALRTRAMREDHSWTASAKRYVEMYSAAAKARRAA